MGCGQSVDSAPAKYDPESEKARAIQDRKEEELHERNIKEREGRYAAVDEGKFELKKEDEHKKNVHKSMLIFDHPKVQEMAKNSGVSAVESTKVFSTIRAYMENKKIDKLSRNDFLICMAKLCIFQKQEELATRFFKLMDSSGDGFVDFGELIAGLGQLSNGSRREKLKVCFQAYDKDQDGGVSKEELKSLLVSQVRASLNSAALALQAEDDFDEMTESVPTLKTSKTHAKVLQSAPSGPRSYANDEFKATHDKDGNHVISLGTFLGKVEVVIPAATGDGVPADPYTRFAGDEILNKMVADIFAKYDKDKNESINFEEFVEFTKNAPELCQWFNGFDEAAK